VPQVTVVIAAHNEASVIERGLATLLADAEPAELAVLVVSNGSADDTADVARRAGAALGHPVEAVDIAEASKIAALRTAEEILAARPATTRVYVDADVLVDTAVIRKLAAAVDAAEPRLGVVTALVDTTGSRPLARRYYEVWEALARNRVQGSGTGVLAVNAAGVPRIASWPDVVSDDEWVVRQFAAAERVVVDARVRQFAARTLPALVRRRARVVNGVRQLDERWPRPAGSAGNPAGNGARFGELRAALRRREIARLDVLVFVAVTVCARTLAAWRRRTGKATTWSRDASSRPAPEAPTS
jgi:glycosyltransferase involved in cell wall biosynthesis